VKSDYGICDQETWIFFIIKYKSKYQRRKRCTGISTRIKRFKNREANRVIFQCQNKRLMNNIDK